MHSTCIVIIVSVVFTVFFVYEMTRLARLSHLLFYRPLPTRIDVLQDQGDKNKFIFYEMYEDMAAVDFHKTQPHYAKWATFKESGGTVTSVSFKMDGLFVP